ncbi:hypothetical protein PPERSA_08573 [Pseudocohnilembus persalinus]|uniref:Uncharacterized protein n=1 Tax=Pseudocohnilembus persalinus TaxID=266149 RepID=A0A0V0R749_PSEPJ|nr:hypothetical protein PPERSA_08573 [Pseudocohnilembus persalinus]|eukprot:KRX10170.1 hypothetical protein PPERSA_08573 [Pseudocohnilembus persalinus]
MSYTKQNKENRFTTNKLAHKSIDLNNNSNVQQQEKQMTPQQNYNGNKQQCNTAQSTELNNQKIMNRQNSFNSMDNNSRRYSLFSKTSFATQNSFLFGTRVFNRSSASKQAPKVNIQSIFKNKAKMYLDEDLTHNFDELLDKGYEMVARQKDEKDLLKGAEEQMKEEIDTIQKEIAPIYQAIKKNEEQINHNQQINNNYISVINDQDQEINHLQSLINSRGDDVVKQHEAFIQQIKELEISNNEIRRQINENKADHRKKVNECEKTIKQLNQHQESLVTELIEKKKVYEEHKLSQATRLRKMENKCKMFMGILKH